MTPTEQDPKAQKREIQNQGQSPDSGETRTKALLAEYMAQGREKLGAFLDAHGVSLPVLGVAMEQFTQSVFALPEGTVCKQGCAHCCHLRVGASIPEVLVIYSELAAQTTQEGFILLKERVLNVVAKGNTLTDAFWLTTRTPCPFLDVDTNQLCLIFSLRPFACRAYHSTDVDACQKGYEQGQKTMIPCFPLYRATTEMYSSILTWVLAQKGFPSYQVGFVKALEILFKNKGASDRWLDNKEDVFRSAKLV